MIKLAIDLGSSMTKIYRADAGGGVVLCEPSCVALSGGRVRAVGREAKRLVGKTAEYTEIVFPVYEGEIVDEFLAAEMLKRFLEKIDIKKGIKKAEALFAIPCGADAVARSKYLAIGEDCGLKKVKLVEIPFLAALGADAVLSESEPVFSIDVGGGMTNIAVVSLCGVIAGVSMNIGGNNMDANVMERIESAKGLRVGALTAERIKNEVGSLAPSPKGATVAEGSSVETSRPASVSVQGADIADCIRVYIDKIAEYATLVLQKLPAEVAAAVNQKGVFLSGGVAKISYVPEYLSRALEMSVHVPEEAQLAVVSGGGALLRDRELFDALTADLFDR